MLFNSVAFALFFPLVTVGYFALPGRARWALLLAASCVFYMAFVPAYILILLLTVAVDYVAGIAIEGAQGGRRKAYLTLSLLTNLGVLFAFKYYNFAAANFSELGHALGFSRDIPLLNMLLPIGLSFHTFQAMSYTIEVYRGHQRAERHLGIYALYVLYYPQLVAGPIERPQNLLHQFHATHAFDPQRVRDGLILMLWGMFKKVVIADRLAPMVDAVFGAPRESGTVAVLIACYAFSIQIFCDFSGYSDVARGCSRVLGIELMVNFDHPYGASNISEFWRRWHVSLSTWFRDYLYFPLGGNRGGLARHLRNIAIVFVLSGLWHGANWNFLVWGALHAAFLMLHVVHARWFGSAGPMQGRVLRTAFTFHLVTFAWIFFRATSLQNAADVIRAGFRWSPSIASIGVSPVYLVMALALTASVFVVEAATRGDRLPELLSNRPAWQRWALYYGVSALVLMLGRFGEQQFIYFQF
jgi:D-alanyl-lipoteichoic acid acyltransferase DltB (MBOAT superfamily)